MSLYPLPKDIPTEVFARVPEKLRRAGGRPAWGGANRPGHDMIVFLKGLRLTKVAIYMWLTFLMVKFSKSLLQGTLVL